MADITDATFVDDVCAFAIRRQARALDELIPLVLLAFLEEFELAGLTINFAAGKTECMVRFRGREAQRIMNERVVDGVLGYGVSRHDGSQVFVQVVVRYKHLGLNMAFDRTDTREARQKTSAALAAYVPLALRVFGSPSIFMAVKWGLARALIEARLFFNIQLMHPTKKNIKQLSSPYMRLVRRIVGDIRGAEMKFSDLELRRKFSIPSVDCHMQQARLRYIAKIAQNRPEELLAALALSTNGRLLPWVELLRDDMVALRPYLNRILNGEVGDPTENADKWFAVMSSFPSEWKRAVSLVLYTRSCCDSKENKPPDGELELKHVCSQCKVGFSTHKALTQHARTVHGTRCVARLYVGADNTCPVCSVVFGIRLRAIAHLSDSRRAKCTSRLFPLMQIPASEVERLDALDKSARTEAQRSGHSRPLAKGQARSASGALLGRARPA